MTPGQLSRQIEAILFVAAEPVTPASLATSLAVPGDDILAAIDALRTRTQGSGLRVVEHAGRYELVTHPDTSQGVNAFLGSQTRSDLSKPALETLAIVAWKQPITKAGIETLRGVSSDQTLKSLLARGLVAEAEKLAEAGHPQTYRTTAHFLHLFGLESPSDLPPLEPVAPAASSGE